MHLHSVRPQPPATDPPSATPQCRRTTLSACAASQHARATLLLQTLYHTLTGCQRMAKLVVSCSTCSWWWRWQRPLRKESKRHSPLCAAHHLPLCRLHLHARNWKIKLEREPASLSPCCLPWRPCLQVVLIVAGHMCFPQRAPRHLQDQITEVGACRNKELESKRSLL